MSMWEPGETVSLQAPALYRKKTGKLYLTDRRIAWVPQGALAPTVRVNHADIRVHLVNAEGSEKVMLKIAEMSDASHSFTFVSPTALKERNEFKDAISAIIAARQQQGQPPAATSSSSTTVSAATSTPGTGASSAGQSPNLAGLRGATPGTAPATPRSSAAGSLKRPLGPGGGAGGSGASDLFKLRLQLLSQNKDLAALHTELVIGRHVTEEEFWETRQHLLRNQASIEQQQKGQSSAWLDLKPETGESNDVKYVMTPQVIHSVCQQYPSIKRAYDMYVPDKLSEAEFWKRYFQSRFFHRSRSGRGANEPDDDIFDRALEEDEEETKNAPKRMRLDNINRLLDLSMTEEDHFEPFTSPDSTMAAGRTKESKEAMPLIRRFNRYAQRVLNSAIGPSKRPNVDSDQLNMSGVEREIVLEDLQTQKESNKILLDIQDTRRYFESQGGDTTNSKVPTDRDLADVLTEYYYDYARNPVDLNKPLAIPDSSFNTLRQNVKANRSKQMPPKDGSQVLPAHLYQAALSCHAAGNEILRHYWASTTPDKMAKHSRMVESLKKIQEDSVKPLLTQAAALGSECSEAMKMMFKPMQRAMEKALKHAESRPRLGVRKLIPSVQP
ncbi:RNA polymerase II transcription factor B subunit 1 [Actinomortierella ambigua]|uniref:RNA polymerase II transcription factor B subunit 1 n=1 Tax=Actinomortierella ambigua TaxID=1343610 RepID=A0A9P6PYV0_9FUNG|nr:RNA polymerase II transcription factor B subunit 1 [Actinomortierella ambigua]